MALLVTPSDLDPAIQHKHLGLVNWSVLAGLTTTLLTLIMCIKRRSMISSAAVHYRTIVSDRLGSPTRIKTEGERWASVEHLVHFDRKVTMVALGLGALFAIQVIFTIHGSSLPIWHQVLHGPSDRDPSVLWGQARGIRSDEWLVATPAILSQIKQNPPLPVENSALGFAQTPLVFGLPVRHLSVLFQPQYWGFFVLPLEQGFAWFWNFRSLSLFLGVFFLGLVLSANTFWLSLGASVLLYYSAFTQWWFSSPAVDLLAAQAWAVLAFFYLLYSRRPLHWIVAAITGAVAAGNFALHLYPPFQVPLLLLALCVVAGKLLDQPPRLSWSSYDRARYLAAALAAAGLLLVLMVFYLDGQETIQRVQETAYPGKRFTLGGGFSVSQYFSGYFDSLMDDRAYPKSRVNICEASSFALTWPILLVMMIRAWRLGYRPSWLEAALWLYVGFVSVFMTLGFPPLVAKVSLFLMTPPARAQIGLGFAGLLLLLQFLSRPSQPPPLGASWSRLTALMVFLALLLLGSRISQQYDQLFTWQQIGLVSLVLACAAFLLLRGRICASLALFLSLHIPHTAINPLVHGLGELADNQIFHAVAAVREHDRQGRWVIYSDNVLPGLFKASGANTLNGVRYVPDLNLFRAFDPSGDRSAIYNRYANILFYVAPDGSPAALTLLAPDTFAVSLPPCSPIFDRLQVRYLVFQDPPPAAMDLSCLAPLTPWPVYGKYRLYHRIK